MADKRYKLHSIKMDAGAIETLEKYKVGKVDVTITGDGRYLVQEPVMPAGGDDLYDQIMKKIEMSFVMDHEDDSDPEVIAINFEREFWETTRRLNKFEEAKGMFSNIEYYIRRDILGFLLIDPLMRDPDIEDVLCSAPARNIRVIHKRYSGRFHTLETNVAFAESRDMEKFIQRMYGRTGTEPTESSPISVTYLRDGSRISCTFGSQVSSPGPVIAIRKFPESPLTVTDMIKSGTMTAEVAAYIWTLLDAKAVGLVIGVTGSGKTTLLGSFTTMMNPRWRILTVEDTLELQIPHPDWVRYRTRKSYGQLSDKFDVTMRHLIDSSLTQRPDYEIIGEIRLDDMDMLFQSVGTGHGGLTSFHASSPRGAITRMRGNKISDGEIALTWFAVHTRDVELDGIRVRRVNDVSEIVPDEETGKISVKPVFGYDVFTDTIKRKAMLQNCERYVEATHVCGIREPEKDMGYRIGLLDECVEKGATDPRSVFRILGRYYSRGGGKAGRAAR